MSFVNFYLIAGTGADINAGSTTGAAQATTTNGNWDATTGAFIAASGTPFAATIVGDYASVYVDGATVTTFVGRVTTVTSSTIIVVDVATIKYGTAPSTSATGRSCTINGAWGTEQVLAAGGLATTTVPQSTKINITGNLTVAASRTISMAGATTAPLWFSAYTTTPGDLDADATNALTKPLWTISTSFQIVGSGAYQTWSGLMFTGNITGNVFSVTGQPNIVLRCRVENTSSNAGAIACRISGGNSFMAYCWCKCPTTATTTGVIQFSNNATCVGVVAEGGGIAGFNVGANATRLYQCVGLTNTGAGVLATTASFQAFACMIYGATVDGFKFTLAPNTTVGPCVVGCLISGLNGSTATTNGINNASGTNTNAMFRACNDCYNVTNPEVGFGDSPAFFGQIDTSPVVTSATNMTPVAGSNALNNGFPGKFENQTFSTYPDIGAVDHADAGGGSAVAVFGG